MIVRIATLALALAALTACDRQEPQDPPPPTPPPAGEVGQAGERTGSQPRTGTQGHAPAPPGASEPAQGGEHYEAGAARTGLRDEGEGTTEEERQAALRACERLQGQDRERCEREVRERTDPAQMPPRQE